MANRSDFDSWIVSIGKKYLAEHPNEDLKITKNTKQSLLVCDYCNYEKSLSEIPFDDYDYIKIIGRRMVGSCSCRRSMEIKINYCPMCGRELINDSR